ncbi:Dihydrofolate synthase [Candidatus Hydrogenisulfobacillus filiaventi]|uniref:tetrahydrofolate synthase n=1 Tax=Candidatus Hydrogenisulfobacillus filiaventi TaxID=2707344 RepID=A0A6F8ZIT4_9FIRM|nr:Dihydrofolate synthase [Candidatus Hydrogenisulfobacillus filiaventi]
MKETWWGGREPNRIKPGLERMQALMERLGHPERACPVIHVAGTNGKGSTVAMIAAALRGQGWRVGMTVSPDLGAINQRVQIGERPLEPRLWDLLGAEVEEAGAGLADVPSFFEAVTALAFLAFRRLAVDVAVVEVGLGGRWDATNVVPPPLLTVITPIAFDHMDRLGHTITAIAGEKAGILKPGSRLVLAGQPYPEAAAVVRARAAEAGVPVREAVAWPGGSDQEGTYLQFPDGSTVRVPLLGAYQLDNLRTAWTAVEELAAAGWADPGRAREALSTVEWPGRFEVVSRDPLIVLDGAHNLHGAAGLARSLRQPPWAGRRWQLVFAALNDKPALAMATALAPLAAGVVVTRVPGERGTDPAAVAAGLRERGFTVPISVEPDPLQAVARARERLGPGEGLLVTGSLALMAGLKAQGLPGPQDSAAFRRASG